jgi:hypothetical protein
MAKLEILPAGTIELINLALGLEYTTVVQLPQLRDAADQVGLGREVWQCGEEAACHTDSMTSAIRRLGGTPAWTFAASAGELGATGLLTLQTERERQLSRIYEKTAAITTEPELRILLPRFARTARSHAQLMTEASRRLIPPARAPVPGRRVSSGQRRAACVG